MRRLLALLLLLSAAPAIAGETLRYQGEGTLWKDTVWEGEVLIDGILTVAPGVTLEIRPGTTIRFTRLDSNGDGIGEHELFVQGVLRGVGTAAQPVRFTSAEVSPLPGDWGALNVMAADEESVLEHCLVEYAYRGFHAHFSRGALRDSEFRRNVRGIQFQESTVSVERCRLVDNVNGLQFRDSTVTLSDSTISGNYWGVRCVYSDLDLRNCRIEGNLVNGANLRDSTVRASGNRVAGNRRGLYLQRSRGTVTGNELLGNSEHGIFLENSDCEVEGNLADGNGRAGIKWVGSRGRLAGNRLTDNGEYALINDGPDPLDARGNWWGTAEPEQIAAAIRDAADRPGVGAVDSSGALPVPPAEN